jgi:hypothetical protein
MAQLNVKKTGSLGKEWSARFGAEIVQFKSIAVTHDDSLNAISDLTFDEHLDWQDERKQRLIKAESIAHYVVEDNVVAEIEATWIMKYRYCGNNGRNEGFVKWQSRLQRAGYSEQALNEVSLRDRSEVDAEWQKHMETVRTIYGDED